MLLTCDIEVHTQTSSPEWMSFGFKTTARVYNILAAVLQKVQLLQN
jgi:hypothetical protein